MFDKNPYQAVGRLSTTWERIEDLVEETVLTLSGCPDYRGKALTAHMQFPAMMRAMRVLLKDRLGDQFQTIKERLGQIEHDIFSVRDSRNSIIHADWLHTETEHFARIVTLDSKPKTSLSSQVHMRDIDYLNQLADLALTAHMNFLTFLSADLGIYPFDQKYALPLHGG